MKSSLLRWKWITFYQRRTMSLPLSPLTEWNRRGNSEREWLRPKKSSPSLQEIIFNCFPCLNLADEVWAYSPHISIGSRKPSVKLLTSWFSQDFLGQVPRMYNVERSKCLFPSESIHKISSRHVHTFKTLNQTCPFSFSIKFILVDYTLNLYLRFDYNVFIKSLILYFQSLHSVFR